jgi:signal transduction histidine kinase
MQLPIALVRPAPLTGAPSLPARLRWSFVCTLAVLLTGIADYATGYEHSLSILYLLPILLATWTMGLAAGLVVCALSLIAWLASVAAMQHVYSNGFYHFWEAVIRIGTWSGFALLLDRLRVALAVADERFVAVLAGLDAAVYVADPQSGELLYKNDRCDEAFGPHLTRVQSIHARLRGGGLPARTATTAGIQSEMHDAGADRWYFVASRAIRWIDGRSVELHIATDVTDRKRAELLVQQQQERLEMASRLTTLGEMASTLAHEINQPLSAIANYCKGSVRRLRSGEWNAPDLLEALEKSATQAERAGNIVQRTRAFLSKRPAAAAPCDVNAAIGAVVRLMEPEAERHAVRIRLGLQSDLPLALADPIMLELVLLNLVRNGLESMHYTPAPRRELALSSSVEGERSVRVDVADHGLGLPGELRQELFIPFFTTKADGMGMGLQICRSIIERHGGRIWASGNAAGGTVLHFTLPRLEL